MIEKSFNFKKINNPIQTWSFLKFVILKIFFQTFDLRKPTTPWISFSNQLNII